MSRPLLIPKLATAGPQADYQAAMSAVSKEKIAILNWAEAFPYCPFVEFQIAHTGEEILLQYFVQEKEVRAEYRQDNDPVYKDSCVEFFISFNTKQYYNFEFNPLGTCLLGYGTQLKQERLRLPAAQTKLIRRIPLGVQRTPEGEYRWGLGIQIPLAVFAFDQLSDLSGRQATAGFYKCGDDLSQPHYLSWKKIVSEQPNFHLPEFFGPVVFQ